MAVNGRCGSGYDSGIGAQVDFSATCPEDACCTRYGFCYSLISAGYNEWCVDKLGTASAPQLAYSYGANLCSPSSPPPPSCGGEDDGVCRFSKYWMVL